MADAQEVKAAEPAKAKVKEPEAPKVDKKAKAFYETTGEFQLYDVQTNKMVPHDGKIELNPESSFVINNLKNKKLRKVD